MVTLRRRALLLFTACLLLLLIGLMTYQAEQRRSLQSLGETLPTVVAARPVEPWAPLTPADLTISHIPRRFAPPGVFAAPDDLTGQMLIAPLPEGAPLTAYLLWQGPKLQPGERTWELRQSGSVLLDSALQPDDRVDVLAAANKLGQEAVEQILQGARVVAVQRKEKEYTITLALSLHEGKALMEAENFARQVRVVRNPLAAGGGRQ